MWREWGKDKENNRGKGADNGTEDRRQVIGGMKKTGEVAAPGPYLYSFSVSQSRNGVSGTINTILSQCLSQRTLPFASVRLTVMESFGLMDASGMGFYLSLPLYLCLHPFTAEMPVCTFSIAHERGD